MHAQLDHRRVCEFHFFFLSISRFSLSWRSERCFLDLQGFHWALNRAGEGPLDYDKCTEPLFIFFNFSNSVFG